MQTKIHPETGETLTRDVRPQTYTINGETITVMVAGWYPEGDGDSIHTGIDLEVFNP